MPPREPLRRLAGAIEGIPVLMLNELMGVHGGAGGQHPDESRCRFLAQ